VTKILTTEHVEPATAGDRDYPELAERVRLMAAIAQPPPSPTEVDQLVDRWAAFVRANKIVLEQHSLQVWEHVIQSRMAKDPDVVNIDPPALYIRGSNVAAMKAFIDGLTKDR
jgi:hypothetical protein